MGRFFSLVFAVVLHVGFILFGGIFFLHAKEDHATLQQVELLSADDAAKEKEKDKPKETPAESKQEMEAEPEPPPEAAELARNFDLSPLDSAPALDTASLAAIENSLFGSGGGAGDFASAFNMTSGGRIGGGGNGGTLAETMENAFSLAEIDQKPRAMFQADPRYPSSMRGKKIEAVVTLIFIVDANGKVVDPRVEKSTHPDFEKPAIDALKQWKYEPAVRGGQRVPCRSRVSIRFPPG